MTTTPEQLAKRVIELSESVSVLSTSETNALILARVCLEMAEALEGSQAALNNFYEVSAAENEGDQREADRRMAMVKEWTAKRDALLSGFRAKGGG